MLDSSRLGALCSVGLTTVALLSATPRSAEASDSASSAPARPAAEAPRQVREFRGRWYGWQGLAGHLIADAGMVTGLVGIYRISPDDPVLSTVPILVGTFSHAWVNLAVHGPREEWANAGTAVGLSLVLPASGTLVGLVAAVVSGGLKANAPAPRHLMIGAAAGLHLAGVIDVAGISFETVREPVRDAARPPLQNLNITPLFIPVHGGAILGLAGSL